MREQVAQRDVALASLKFGDVVAMTLVREAQSKMVSTVMASGCGTSARFP